MTYSVILIKKPYDQFGQQVLAVRPRCGGFGGAGFSMEDIFSQFVIFSAGIFRECIRDAFGGGFGGSSRGAELTEVRT